MEDLVEFDFGDDDLIIMDNPQEETQVEELQEEVAESTSNEVDPVEQDDTEIIEESNMDDSIDNDEESAEVDIETHQLFIEGWRETGLLVLPDGYDAKDKTVTQVMTDSAKYFNEAIKQNFVESLPEDIQEVARLAIEGKIKNAKEYLSYQVEADKIVENISSTEDARRFLETYYKENTDLDADDIEQTLDRLELYDKIVEKAASLKTKVDEKTKQDIEVKKQQLLQREAEAKVAKEREMSERITKVKTYIDKAAWTNEHKKFVQEEISQGMKTTVGNIQAAITDPDVTPEFVSLMSRLLVKDANGKISISMESLKEFASSNVAKDTKSTCESQLHKTNLTNISRTHNTRENLNEIEYELLDF